MPERDKFFSIFSFYQRQKRQTPAFEVVGCMPPANELRWFVFAPVKRSELAIFIIAMNHIYYNTPSF